MGSTQLPVVVHLASHIFTPLISAILMLRTLNIVGTIASIVAAVSGCGPAKKLGACPEPPMSEVVPRRVASEWTARHRKHLFVAPGNRRVGLSASFDKVAIADMLKLSDDVAGIKIYYGLDGKGIDKNDRRKDARILLVPIDKNGKDLINKSDTITNKKQGYYILSTPMRCPDNCDNNVID